MAVSDQTRSGDLAETFKSERETTKNQIRVALPGIVQSFAPDAVTAVVQPAIRYVEIDNDGNRITKNYPLLVDVPVVFPRGGGCTLTFPVKAGDECLVIFADRCIDSGGRVAGYRSRSMTECMIYRMRFVLSVPSRRQGRLAVLIPVPHSCVVMTAAPILSLILIPGKLKLSLRGALMWLPLWLIFLRK